MALRNGELMHECFLKNSHMRTARMKQGKETDEEGKKRCVTMERSNAGTKKKLSQWPITS